MDYELLDSGDGKKLERFQDVLLIRPAATAIWPKTQPSLWKQHSAEFIRVGEKGEWKFRNHNLKEWWITIDSVRCLLKLTPFGHVGIFPEHATFWRDLRPSLSKSSCKVLNLFAYTGGATVACLASNASVCHVDSSKGMVNWAKENVQSSGLEKRKVRYSVDDVVKFVNREIRRENKYDAIIMDPPSYGRGTNGEVWQFEDNIYDLVELCTNVLSDNPLFFLINSYTTGISSTVLANILNLTISKKFKGKVSSGEIGLPMENSNLILPCGIYGRWEK